MILRFILDGSIPSKKNSKRMAFKNGRTYIFCSKQFNIWHRKALQEIVIQKNQTKSSVTYPIRQCKGIDVYLFFGDRHESDNTNKVESIHDLLVDAGILTDDNWCVTGITKQIPFFIPGKARCEIDILLDEANYLKSRCPEDFPNCRNLQI